MVDETDRLMGAAGRLQQRLGPHPLAIAWRRGRSASVVFLWRGDFGGHNSRNPAPTAAGDGSLLGSAPAKETQRVTNLVLAQ